MPPPPEDLKSLFEGILADVEVLTERIVHVIRTEIPDYKRFPYDIHYTDSLHNLTAQLERMVSGAGPDPESVVNAREMARIRVSLNVPLTDAIEGYHIAFRELWAEIVRRTGDDLALAARLPSEVGRIWAWFHVVSSAYAEEYMIASRVRALSRAESVRRLMHDAGSAVSSLESTAVDLGYDLNRSFRVYAAPAPPAPVLEQLDAALALRASPMHAADLGAVCVLLTQDQPEQECIDVLRRAGVTGPIGVGLARRGVPGIRDSLTDAQQVLDLPEGSDVRYFSRSWPLTMLFRERDRMSELLSPGVQAARDHPHLAEVVAAFAQSQYSISATARELHIHPNTARYRITRWRELTGWDLFTVRGLLSSLAALQDSASGAPPVSLG